MIQLMLYAAVVSALLGVVAVGGDGLLRLYRLPGRWVCAAALALSLAAPLAGPRWLANGERESGGVSLGEATVIAAGSPGDGVAPSSWLAQLGTAVVRLDRPPRIAWLLSSGAMLLFGLAGALRLERARRRWRPGTVNGVDVLVSPDVGPALVGFFKSAIVLPNWALDMPPSPRSFMLLHEEEHRRAGDQRLLLGGLVALVAMPWNPVTWWQLRRLREAMEVDCDARVLRARPDVRAYGSVLLEVGSRVSGARLVPAFAEGRRAIEQRIRAMTERPPRYRAARAIVLAALAALGVGLACEVPAPSLTEPEASQPAGTASPRTPVVGTTRGPSIERARVAAQGGAEELARTDEAEEAELSGSPDDLAGVLKRLRDEASERSAEPRSAGRGAEPSPSWLRPSQVPSDMYTPMTQRPELLNANEVSQNLNREYPALIRDAGVGGTTVVWLYLDIQGQVQNTRVDVSSGVEALDVAAMAVATTMRFTPAYNGDQKVPVWVKIPMTFRPN